LGRERLAAADVRATGVRGFLDTQPVDGAQHEDNPERLRQIRYGLLEKLGDLAPRGINFGR
jgi:hypothetical protein